LKYIGHTSKSTANWQHGKDLASVLLGIKVTLPFYFELPLTCSNQIGLYECQMWTSQSKPLHVCRAKPLCKNIK